MRGTLDFAACVTAQADGPEKVLLSNIQRVLKSLSTIPLEHRELLSDALTKIIHGQTLDIERFESDAGVHGLADDSALEEYTYLVAGCVGEFWTKVCYLEWPGYARLPEAELLGLGRDFGKGLQLINILRDYPVDLQAGRSYLPISNLDGSRLESCAGPAGVGAMAPARVSLSGSGLEICDRGPTATDEVRLRGSSVHRRSDPASSGRRARNSAGNQSLAQRVRQLMAWAAGVALFPFLEPYAYRKILR